MDWFIVALGSNRPGSWGNPEQAVRRAIGLLYPATVSRILPSRPIGPSRRSFVNAVAIVESDLPPPAFLDYLKALEHDAGRRPGQRWSARPLDLDIIGWSGGMWASPGLSIPHPEFRRRRFVLAPLAGIAPDWRDPMTHLTVRQTLARLDRKRPRS
ncbi:2-amino-4-hydroxy-6-hydroxymethyldihydropteridinepyrophosphokinase [Sphingomonas antarctica]|uniref:2-amino-4-hydroxy-6- hydroxymethyldihydropteridine diphosphokinase n=1 Tax=Sphingomonas antarctica TaxID=2040274 RepID=UPI0039EB8CF2